MKRLLSLILLAGVFFAAPAFAADPIVGTWKLNVAKSKYSPGPAPKGGTTRIEAACSSVDRSYGPAGKGVLKGLSSFLWAMIGGSDAHPEEAAGV